MLRGVLRSCTRWENGSSRPTRVRHSNRLSVRSMNQAGASIRNKNVAVIGSSRGIGLEFVKQLLDRDNTVHATARAPKESQGLQELLKQYNGKLSTNKTSLDTASSQSINAWAQELVEGKTAAFDYVFVVAGVADNARLDLANIDDGTMINLFQTNAMGPLFVAKHLVNGNLVRAGSVIVNITSKMGSVTDNTSGGAYAYRASKAALNQITKSMAIDLEPSGITVALLHPGWVKTDMTKGNGLITATESVSGMLSVLESGKPLSGHFYDYKHEEIPW